MGSKWKKVKMALQGKMCIFVPKSSGESPRQSSITTTRFSDAGVSSSPTTPRRSGGGGRLDMPTTPVPSSSGLRLPKHSSTKKTCAICLNTLKPGHGHAIFTAECSHSFHFHCITSNVKYGNQMCPICRAKWKEVPFQSPTDDIARRSARNSDGAWPQDDPWVTNLRRLPSPRLETSRHNAFLVAEPTVFNDDDELHCQVEISENSCDLGHGLVCGKLDLKAYLEVSAVSKFASHNDFTVLIHLKAPNVDQPSSLPTSTQSRVPVDLVTVLDVSGSMAGTKLALLKRAMGFVIQNLGPSDRLSVIAFSSTARRLFSLRRMTDTGKEEALEAVNLLNASGGTNIIEALKKGAKVMTDRKSKNPVSSVILLSDGQDNYSISPSSTNRQSDYQSLLPVFMHRGNNANIHIPVHSFGFGADHDPISMHSISENSGGTFSFIETESVIQDAFAQCIGGLLSVVVQELLVTVECLHSGLQLNSIKAGSYKNMLMSDRRMGSVELGDLYADEERDFLITLDIPVEKSLNEVSILKINCAYKDPVSEESMTLNQVLEVKILRPEITGELVVSMEVDKHRNRLRSAEAMSEARAAAEHGDLAAAVSVLEECRKYLVESVSYRAGDKLSIALDAELKEMQERMANRQTYERSGRAYVLSGLSSHWSQRATARGDSTDSTSLVQSYQTPSMVNMVSRSQTLILGSTPPRPSLKPALSFPARPWPR